MARTHYPSPSAFIRSHLWFQSPEGRTMRKLLHHGITRAIARFLVPVCLLMWGMPPAAAFRKPPRPAKTQELSEEQRAEPATREKAKRQPPVRALSADEMWDLRGRGPYRNRYLSG